MVKRQRDRQKDKKEDTNAQRQSQNTAQIVFGKICGVWLKHHRFWSNSTDFEWMIWVESGVMS